MKNILAKVGEWLFINCIKPLPKAVCGAAVKAVLHTWIVAIVSLIIAAITKEVNKKYDIPAA